MYLGMEDKEQVHVFINTPGVHEYCGTVHKRGIVGCNALKDSALLKKGILEQNIKALGQCT